MGPSLNKASSYLALKEMSLSLNDIVEQGYDRIGEEYEHEAQTSASCAGSTLPAYPHLGGVEQDF